MDLCTILCVESWNRGKWVGDAGKCEVGGSCLIKIIFGFGRSKRGGKVKEFMVRFFSFFPQNSSKQSIYVINLACVAGAKRGGGGEREKSAKPKPNPNPNSSQSPPFFPSSLSPTPFDACYAGYDKLNINHIFFCTPQQNRIWY